MKKRNKRGVAALPTVMVLGVVSLAVAIGVTAVALTESFIAQGSAQSSRALFYAEAGMRDALIRVARNKNFSTVSYTIDFTTNGSGCASVPAGCATISVSSTVPKVATSTGVVGGSTRVLTTTITQDADGAITNTVWSESTN